MTRKGDDLTIREHTRLVTEERDEKIDGARRTMGDVRVIA